MNTVEKWESEQNARRVWEAAAAKRQELQARLEGATACYERTKREREAVEARITQAVAGEGTLEAAFRSEVAQLRGDCDRLAKQVAELQKLFAIVGGEEKRTRGAWEKCHASLLDRDGSGFYEAGILSLMAERGEVCLGHRVRLRDETDGSTFDCVLAGGETPVERAVRGRFVGDHVTVDAPGGAYVCEIVSVEVAVRE